MTSDSNKGYLFLSITFLIVILFLGFVPNILFLYFYHNLIICFQPPGYKTFEIINNTLGVASVNVSHLPLQREDSLCSKAATDHGLHQKVISFSFFINPSKTSLPGNSKYFIGIERNIQKAKQFYPDWLIRIYTYHSRSYDFDERLLAIAAKNSNVFICDIENIPTMGNIRPKLDGAMWRFLPMFDPTVDIFISRDLDSGFSLRELVAVTAWIKSNKTFHAMRDHPSHGMQILAGMWGAKTAKINSQLKKVYRDATFTFGTMYGLYYKPDYDQYFLVNVIYPVIVNNLLVHDSYHCTRFHDSVPFPTKRRGATDFVANFDPNPIKIPIECPLQCRPSYGKDWKLC